MICVTLHCDALRLPLLPDSCQERYPTGFTRGETARKHAERAGWGFVDDMGGLDVCPQHWQQFQEAERRYAEALAKEPPPADLTPMRRRLPLGDQHRGPGATSTPCWACVLDSEPEHSRECEEKTPPIVRGRPFGGWPDEAARAPSAPAMSRRTGTVS